MTLIEMVRETRRLNCQYFAVDKNNVVYAHKEKAMTQAFWSEWQSDNYFQIGVFNLKCDWRKTLINVDNILVK